MLKMLRAVARGLAVTAGGGFVAVAAIGGPKENPLPGAKPVPLDVPYEKSVSNMVDGNAVGRFIVRVCPSLLHKVYISMNAPKPGGRPKDVHEANLPGADALYRVEEVRPGSVFLVDYNGPAMTPPKVLAAWLGEGHDTLMAKAVAAAEARPAGESASATAAADIAAYSEYVSKSEEDYKNGQTGQLMPMTMGVVRLKTGGVMLFSPVVVHPGTAAAEWLASLGDVRYIVAGSSAHTIHLAEVLAQHPNACVIGSGLAQAKLAAVDALPRGRFDRVVATSADAAAVNAELVADGVVVHAIEGDSATHAVTVVADRTAFEADLLYGHHDACPCERCVGCGPYHTKPEYAIVRTFVRLFSTPPKAPCGLPDYRKEMMDPTAGVAAFMGPFGPAPDGSSPAALAAALRRFLSDDFDVVVSAHVKHPITADDFRKSIDWSWRWLDGKPLV